MKKLYCVVLFAAMLLAGSSVAAQGDGEYVVRLDANTNGSVVNVNGGAITLRDDDSQGFPVGYANPMLGIDYHITLVGGCSTGGHIAVIIDTLSVSCLDTVYIYDGPDTNGLLLAKFNSFTGNVAEGDFIYESPSNTTGMITIRFRTDPLTDLNRVNLPCEADNGGIGRGFVFNVACSRPCETVKPVIDTMFYRTRNGVIYDSAFLQLVHVYDTVLKDEDILATIVNGDINDSIDHIDTNDFIGANLCIGDGVIFRGYGDYSYRYGYYIPNDSTSFYRWFMGNGDDSIVGIGQSLVEYNDYQRTGCFDVSLYMKDSAGCEATDPAMVRVRTSLNPIKTIFTLQDICNRDSLMVNMGYDGENATLTLRKVEQDSTVSKTYEVRTFIPDGCYCATPSYFEAPVEFTEFPNARKVTSAKDICSICINMEHSFLGDFYLTIVCPTGQEAVLKWGNPSQCPPVGLPAQAPQSYTDQQTGISQTLNGGSYGSGDFLGFPYDGGWPGISDGSNKCDSLQNPYGVGLDYCFSRDSHYTLVTGDNAGTIWSSASLNPSGNFYIVSSGNMVNLPVTFPPIPAGFSYAGTNPGSGTMNTKKPSDHENKTDYYLPWATFKELVGCPLNGLWKIRVYDTWGADNGWIFNWTLDICNTSENDCKYEVGLDSLIWRPKPDSIYHDYDLGHYRGLEVHKESPTVSWILSPDTAGTFPIDVLVYDAFGCVWDTTTRITSYWTPQPDLGPDTVLCGVDSKILDATDRHSATENYTYQWSPYPATTDTIRTATETGGDVTYVVQVTNTKGAGGSTVCQTRDTVVIGMRRQPLPSFMPSPFVFEGCDPFTLSFENMSIDADKHFWDFGDGVTSTLASPTHTFAAGIYDLKYYATSADGCIDSVISPQSIAVYPAPQAAFAWEPLYPSVLHPTVTLDNRTSPKTENTHYFWEVQYNPDNPRSVHTVTDENPVFDFSQYIEDDPSGLYSVRLIARTDNLAPSGNMVYCRDTVENTILLVNDFLQFPNVVTPNGDGINDRFVIRNLVDGQGYPVNSLDVYNKWGTHVYHKDNITRDEDFWDPKDVPAGTYFYRFSARGYNGNIEHNGAVEVVK